MTQLPPLIQGEHAIVIGSSVAGLLAGRILSDHFQRVTIIERDKFTDSAEARKGAPQARHAHAVLARAVEVIDQLFPDFFTELEAVGSVKIDMCYDLAFFHFGKWKKRFPSDVYSYFQTRTFLEWKLRQRVMALPNVTMCDGTGVAQYLAEGNKIIGVKLQNDETLNANLVVDASGRGSRTPQWLEALGYPRVEEKVLTVDIAYSTRLFKRTGTENVSWKSMFVYPQLPGKRLGVILPTEDPNLWLVTLGGIYGDHPPTDDAGFLEFARSLPTPELYEFLKDKEPASPILVHKLPSNLRRVYEHMARFPDQLIVLGDALCSFNPIYGQGMTTAALEALVLDNCLKQYRRGNMSLDGFSMRFQKLASGVIANPWLLATAEDMRYPECPETVPAPIRFLHWYTGRIHDISDENEIATLRFTQVMNMQRSPWVIFQPRLAWHTLRG